jgi:signal peptidase
MSRMIFDNDEIGTLWVSGESDSPDSRILLTVSNDAGENTVVITPDTIAPSNSRLYVQAPPERVVVKERKYSGQFGSFFTFVGYAITAVLLSFVLLSATGRLQARVVLTGSMVPAINSGDIVILDPLKTMVPKLNDIVTYTGRRFDGTAVASFTHRIVGGDLQTGFIVKGDANRAPDVQRVKRADIIGKVVFKIPFLGRILMPKTLMTLVPMIFIFWLLIDKLRDDK